MAIAGLIALTIAALGLFALSAYTTERRTKEIGVRKAMGASSGDILKLLLWQFTKPVLWANLIAWPAAYLFIRQWLKGYATRITPGPATFIMSAAAVLALALITTSFQTLRAALANPAESLRHE